MSNLIFGIGLIGILAVAIIASRSLARFAILTLFTVMVSGAILQFFSSHSLDVTFGLTQWWLLVTGLVLALLSIYYGRARGQAALWSRASNTVLIGSSALIAVAFFTSRLLAPGELAPLSSVGYFVQKVAAEDNAKWLNATSQLADASVIDTWANVGGPMLLIMSFAGIMIGTVSFLLYGSVNEVAVSAGSVIFVQIFFVVIAPFALAPIVERTYRKIAGGAQLPMLYSLLSIAIISASNAVLLTYGHITLQFTIIAITLWIGAFLAPISRFPARLFTTLAVVAASMVWFPLAGLSLVILLGALVYFGRGLFSGPRESRKNSAISFTLSLILGALTIEFLNSALRYSLGVDSASAAPIGGESDTGFAGGISTAVRTITAPTLPLFDDPGGTEQITTLLLVLTLVSILGLVWVRVGRNTFTRGRLKPFIPIVLSGGYALAIAFTDFWAVGDGPNYGSLKISFAVFLPILVCSLPFALMTFHRGSAKVNGLGVGAVALIVIMLTLDTLFPRAVLQLKPTNWPGVSGSPYWYPAEVRDTGDQTLASNPIGCVFLPRGAIAPTGLPQGQLIYTCTRLLAGVAGVETLAAPIVKWELDEWLQNRTMWSEVHPQFSALSPEIQRRNLILLDNDRQVVGLESLGILLNRFPPLEP
ncbi:hypothetical protein [Arsukibacterium sp.]|uniref:hypothetical protein n=1 Tax=Arsukibacterium sp. TaxID=1977258 RepID=UPI001BD6570A|nr:hypothetical protein [Arsukibacterium sp.]